MKKNSISILSLLLLVACSEEIVINNKINFTVGLSNEVNARIITDIGFTTTFEKDDAIGIFIYKRNAEQESSIEENELYVDNRKMTYDGNAWHLESPLYYPDSETLLDVYAYYPYLEGANAKALEYNASLGMKDLLAASVIGIKKEERNILLMFDHLLSLAHVRITKDKKVSAFDKTFKAYFNGVVSGEYNLEKREINNPQKGIVNMELVEEISLDERIYRAWVPAQIVEPGILFSFIQMTSNKEILSSKDIDDPLEFSQGRINQFNIKLTNEIEKDIKYYLYDSYPRYGTPVGIIVSTWNDGRNGKAMSIIDLEDTQWSTEQIDTGSLDRYDGISNKMKIQSIQNWEEKYPAFKLCSDYGERWYLPSHAEAYTFLYVNRNAINNNLNRIPGSQQIVLHRSYFTSTEVSRGWVYKIYPNDGVDTPMGKNEIGKIRAFYEF